MNRDQFEGNWHQLKGKVREKWGQFTNDDIAKMSGKYEQFLGSLQKKYGYSKERAEQELKNWKFEEKKEHYRKEGHHDRRDEDHKRRKAG